jgi:ferredoxin-NADP reductase
MTLVASLAGVVAAGGRRVATSPWLRPLNDPEALDGLLALVDPLWSVARVRARVVRLVDETPDMRTFVLRPNARWRGHAAGQHVCVDVDVDGVRHHRTYSLSSAPGDRTIAITVKRQPGGRVSCHLHDRVRPGDVLDLGQAAGRFVLPEPAPARLAFVSAGSGITPIVSMVRLLHARRAETDVVLVHSCRTAEDAAFRAELLVRARAWRRFRPVLISTAESGRLDRERLARLVPDWATRLAYVCGPDPFMAMADDLWSSAGLADRVRRESFGGVSWPARSSPDAAMATVSCTRSGVTFTAAPDRPLLLEAERAGLRPRAGCRRGICHTCVVRKVAGTVENLATGAVNSDADATIQLCVSIPRGDVTLAL